LKIPFPELKYFQIFQNIFSIFFTNFLLGKNTFYRFYHFFIKKNCAEIIKVLWHYYTKEEYMVSSTMVGLGP
jgi:hypothetical protein